MNEKKSFLVAIDGPVAAGKGTIAQRLANELNGLYLYTGAMYRCVALFCIENNVSWKDTEAIISTLSSITIRFHGDDVLLNGKKVTERIKAHDTANGASIVAVIPEVREALVIQQQEIAHEAMRQGKIVVSEGRDTATRVFPDASLKIFLTASEEVRAKRRMLQYQQKGEDVSFETILQEVRERDKRDKGRSLDPLSSTPDKQGYLILDDSLLNEKETLKHLRNALKENKLL